MKVLIADKISDTGIARLRDDGFTVDVKTGLSEDELVSIIPDYAALIVRSATKATRPIIEAADALKIIGRAGVGIDNVDVAAATERGIIVCNAPTSNIVSAAEHTIALVLASARSIPQANASMKAGKWERSKFTGAEVYDKTLGIVGLGRIGTLVAERARGLGMKLIGYDPYITEESAASLGVELIPTVDELLPKADFITVHLPKTKETIGMFGAKQFARMKDGVRLVNTARGGIYQEDALVAALKSGKVASAAVDVFEVEPCTESLLHHIDNVILTPHLGASTEEAQDRAGDQIAELVAAGLRDEPVSTAVNIPPVPAEAMEALRPWMPLAEDLGKMLAQTARGGIDELDVAFIGALSELDTRILKTAVLKGMLEVVTPEGINYVNAGLRAEMRGIKVSESKRGESHDYVSLIEVTANASSDPILIGGALVGKRNEPRLVSLFDYDVDMAPSAHMTFFRYADVPGMIGKIGTILGESGTNIASMQVGRTKMGGEAVMGLNVDTAVGDDLLVAIKEAAGAKDAWTVEL